MPALLAPAERPSGVPPLVRIRRVQQRILIVVLAASMFRAAVLLVIVRVAVGLDFGGPGVVGLGGFARGVVRVDLVRFVGEGAGFEEGAEVVGGYGGCEDEEDAGEGLAGGRGGVEKGQVG